MESEAEEDDLLPTEDSRKKGEKKKKVKKSVFASYDEFAHLLEEGMDEREDKQKERKHFA